MKAQRPRSLVRSGVALYGSELTQKFSSPSPTIATAKYERRFLELETLNPYINGIKPGTSSDIRYKPGPPLIKVRDLPLTKAEDFHWCNTGTSINPHLY